MGKIIVIITACLLHAGYFYGQLAKPEHTKLYYNISAGYFNLHQYAKGYSIFYNRYSTIENAYLKTGIGIANHQFKTDLFVQNLFLKKNDNLFMFGIEANGNILNSENFYLGPLTQLGFCESDYDYPLISTDYGFDINWPLFFSLGMNGGYRFITVSVYKQYADANKLADKRSWMVELSVDCIALYRTIKKNDKNENKK